VSGISLNSLSSSLMFSTTLYRNQNGCGSKLAAQMAYAVIALVAIVETAVAGVFFALSLLTYPCTSAYFQRAMTWLKSSAFSIVWAAADFAMNLFFVVLVADEPSAWQIFKGGDLSTFPLTTAIINPAQIMVVPLTNLSRPSIQLSNPIFFTPNQRN
jgi:hypothetical protein